MQVKDLKAGDNIEVIELVVKNVSQGKFGKPPGNTPYQHLWLTDGTADIRFSLFGDDVNKLQEGQTVRIISSYVKEYPAGSGKLQIALGKGGNWQIASGSGQPVDRDDVVAAPIQIMSSDARDVNINRQSARRDAIQFLATYAGIELQVKDVLEVASQFYEWAMGIAEKSLESEGNEPPDDSTEHPGSHPTQYDSRGFLHDSQSGTGPQATKLKLIADAAIKENSGWTGPPTTDVIQKFAATMNGILGGDKERHTWLKWTYGVESSKEVTGAKLQVVLDLLKPSYTDKKWIPTQNAEAIKAMFKQALIDAGQTEMTFKETVEELYGP